MIVVVFAATAGCESGPSDRASSEKVPEWHIAAAPEAVIGTLDGPPEYLFHRIRWVGIVGDDLVAVADIGSMSIRIYDTRGRFVRSIGRKGSGPGEFTTLHGLLFSPPDTIHVFEPGSQRVTSVLVDGSLAGTRRLAGAGPGMAFAAAFANGDFVQFWLETVGTGGEQRFTAGNPAIVPDAVNYEYFDVRGEHTSRLAQERGRWRYAPAGGVQWQGAPPPGLPAGAPVAQHPFSPRPIHFARGDTIFLTDGLRPFVTARTSDGDIVRTIPLPATRLASYETALARYRQALEERGDDRRLARLRDVPRIDSLPRVSAMLMDDQGLFWAKHFDPATDALGLSINYPLYTVHGGDWWVFDSQGKVRATVRLPPRFILKEVRGSLLAGITIDSLQVERVVLYRLIDRS